MKTMRLTVIIAIVATTMASQGYGQAKINVAQQIQLSAEQYKGLLQDFPDTTYFPQSVLPDGTHKRMRSEWWCSGFFGGSLWFLYEYTNDEQLKQAAGKWTWAVAKEQYNTGTHDLGFMVYCPFGNGYAQTKNEAYVPVMLQGATSLATRFNPKVGVIKSWNSFAGYEYPVIIDNMMNLELLFWASRISGDKRFYNMAVTHADNTMKNHFRADNSSYHVVCYDSAGNVAARKTAQGYADNSSWARGQAWGLYGYVVMYRETNDTRYLDQAIRIADFFTKHPNLPEDKIPYWDFNAPGIPDDVRDASSAAIAASALLELQQYVKGSKKKAYFKFAEDVLQSLSSPAYFAVKDNNHFLLKHSTGHKPAKSEIDTPIIYADYYYLEALLRYDKLTAKK